LSFSGATLISDGESLLARRRAGPAKVVVPHTALGLIVPEQPSSKGFAPYETIQRSFQGSCLPGLSRHRLSSRQAANTPRPQDLPAALQAMFWQGAGKEGALACHSRQR
jgi:hypothetical protein